MATALDVIDDAYTLIGVKAAGDTTSAARAQYALRQLNILVSSWRLKSLTALAITKGIFPLVANQQVYYIGLGQQWNFPRPATNDVQAVTLLYQGLSSAQVLTSLTRSGHTVTGTLTAHGLAAGDTIVIYGEDCDPAYNGQQTVVTVPTADTFTYTILDLPTSPATGTVNLYTLAPSDNQNLEIPVPLLSDAAYQAIQLKAMSNPLFTQAYYQATQPFGTFYLWPRPNTAANQIVLYLRQQFQGFANLSTDYTWPDTSGYYDALQTALACKLYPSFPGLADIGELKEQAREALALVKRSNTRIVDLANDAATAINGWQVGGYNILTGNQ